MVDFDAGKTTVPTDMHVKAEVVNKAREAVGNLNAAIAAVAKAGVRVTYNATGRDASLYMAGAYPYPEFTLHFQLEL